MDNAITVGGWSAYDGRGRLPTDAQGCTWSFATLEGWFGGVGLRAAPIDRPNDDGTYDGPAPLEARTVTITGDVHAPTRGALQQALDRISGLLTGTVRRDVLVVNEAIIGLKRRALVRLGGPTLVQRLGPYDATWSITLYAPDPVRYNDVLKTRSWRPFAPGGGRTYTRTYPRVYSQASGRPGTFTATNVGNADTWPVFRIAGPIVNPRIRVAGGPMLGFKRTVDNFREIVVDTGNRTAMMDGTSLRAYMTADSQWFSMPPGDTDFYFEADSGDAQITVEWRDGWS